jgi:hypothetical protein
MKKLTALFIVLLIVTGAAFAQDTEGLSIGSWGRAVFVPFQGEFEDGADPEFNTGVGAGWRPAYMGLSFSFSEADGRIGGKADLNAGQVADVDGVSQDARAVGIGDNLHIWAKPFGSDILYIAIGKIVDSAGIRGLGSVDDDFNGYIGGMGSSGDPVFTRFDDAGGALFISKPISNLSIFAMIKPGFGTLSTLLGTTDPDPASDAYKKIQAGFAYDISSIGKIRAQWYGASMDGITFKAAGTGTTYTANNARIEAAFLLNAVENLNLDLGIKIPVPVEENDVTYQGNFQANVIGDYTAGDFKVAFGLYGAFGGSAASKSWTKRADLQPSFTAIVIPSFYVAAIDATVGGDIGFKALGESSSPGGRKNGDNGVTFGAGGWISRKLGKSGIKTGLAYQFPKYGSKGTTGQTSYLTWPIILTASF